MYADTNNPDTVMNINEQTVELVALAGSQTAAATLSGVSQANLSKLARGEIGAGVKAETADKIKKTLAKLRRSAKRKES